jgi:hypothetical protein
MNHGHMTSLLDAAWRGDETRVTEIVERQSGDDLADLAGAMTRVMAAIVETTAARAGITPEALVRLTDEMARPGACVDPAALEAAARIVVSRVDNGDGRLDLAPLRAALGVDR